ncbi:MAG: CpaF family protein [Actinobacteria bacterium]|nr:CpaF family protein [Actinomycetota bacterium]
MSGEGKSLADRLAHEGVGGNGKSLADRLAKAERPDRIAETRARIQNRLVEVLGPTLYDDDQSEPELRELVVKRLREILEEEDVPFSAQEKGQIIRQIGDSIVGFGPLEPFIRDPDVTEIMVNSAETIYVERAGKLYWTGAKFHDDRQLRWTIDKIVTKVGRRIDEASPYVDARLPDGSRVNAIIPPLAVDGPALTIRKFAADPYETGDLVAFGTISDDVAGFLEACVRGRTNVLVSGGTGAGKTTTLNVLSSFIPHDERIITIEDAAELKLQQPHVVRLEYRPPNIEGRGEVTIRDLVRNALRMRPDRIVVGEVRGGEALDMLQAMNTGHDGSISTIHANSPRDSLSRLETVSMMAGMELTVRALREQIASAIDLIIHQARLKDGSRRITHITEVVGMEGDVITIQDIFLFDFRAGTDQEGRFVGGLRPTGLRPKFLEKLEDKGIRLGAAMFMPAGAAR